MSELTIIEIKQENALAVFTEDKGLDPYLEKIAKEARAIVADIATKKGRDQIASTAYKVRQSKTALDKVGKTLVDTLKEQPKLVDAERKRMRDFLDNLASEVRKPLDDFEAAEASRVQGVKDKIDELKQFYFVDFADSDAVKDAYSEIDRFNVDESFAEFEAEAHREKALALSMLSELIAKQLAYEREQAELVELRRKAAEQEQKDRETQIAKEAEERARLEAQQAAEKLKQEVIDNESKAKEEAERLRLESIARETQLKLDAEKAQREKLEAEEKAKQDVLDAIAREKKEAADKLGAEQAEITRRQNDKDHKRDANIAAKNDFMMHGISSDDAEKIIKLIASKLISNIVINY